MEGRREAKALPLKQMKKPISATIDDELIKWVDKEISQKRNYRNRSHLIEMALDFFRKEQKKEERKNG